MVIVSQQTLAQFSQEKSLVLWFDEVGIGDIALVGGKNASLGEMIQQLTPKGVNVPGGFATTAYAYRYFIQSAGLEVQLRELFADLDVEDVKNLQERGLKARSLLMHTPFPLELQQAIAKAYTSLCEQYHPDTDVAVRSSATAEDLPDASFAGQQETYLNVVGVEEVLMACHKCFASLFTDRAISYRQTKGFDHFSIALAVGVQKMVRADLATSGVMFSIDTETGFKDAALITAAYGLGENVVQGTVNPDEYYVFKPTLKAGFKPIIDKKLGSKELRMVYDQGSQSTKNEPVSTTEQNKFALSDEDILQLANWACLIEDHYSQAHNTYTPMDIEWAKDGITNQLFVVQARPETVQSQKNGNVLRSYRLVLGTGEWGEAIGGHGDTGTRGQGDKEKLLSPHPPLPLVTGRAIGEAISQGKARVILDTKQIQEFQAGEVLVTERTDPDWEPIMKRASAIITNSGGRTCFAGNTKILTNKGFMTLRQIYEQGHQGLFTLSLNTQTDKIEWKPILDSMKRQSKMIGVSVSQTGRVTDNILNLTPDHKMINIRGGQYVKTEIQEMLAHQEMLVTAQHIPFLSDDSKEKNKTAYLLGGILTDGSIYRSNRHGEVQFIQKNIPQKQQFISAMNDCVSTVYGKAFVPYQKAKSSGYIRGQLVVGEATAYRLYSKQIAYELYEKEQNIVSSLLNNSVEFSYNFLGGVIDGDGCYFNNRISIYISEELLLQAVIVACLKIGTVPQVTKNRNIYNVQLVENLKEILKFTNRVKGEVADRTIQTRFFATKQLFGDDVKGQLKLRRDNNLLISDKQLQETDKFAKLLAGDIRMQRVVSIDEATYGDVYNITVAEHHNYVVFTSKYTPVIVCNCHAAIIARELGVPAIVGCGNATVVLTTGQDVTVSCAEGEEGKVYPGLLPFAVQEVPLENLPRTHTQILMNVGNPQEAFSLSAIPNDGVGLARTEFIIANQIQVHPLALIYYDKLEDAAQKAKIAAITAMYDDKPQYFIDKLAQGVGRIAAAFYPKPVIVRMSDFKSNEYRNLAGGQQFEPEEENPMLGWRGAARYYDAGYREGFALECHAIKRVRDEMGLTNVIPMIPFCRTPEEGRLVLDEMAIHGLKQGVNDLQVYVMCELPSNVILAEQFAEVFDGFSIGSNDLTQLTLGLDRDSALVARLFDERSPAVKQMVKMAIASAKKQNRKIGICGQAPSDYPEFAQFLVEQGIDSISLNPDSVLKTMLEIAKVEQQTQS
ncbi:phosphoenolpyruvate synthase [Nostoc sp. TCL26-01]|uniref:phosphoenolpyruvate synthase n=1 Tax=Nostoc sp. TCL26-01 TaxID=2576904 RepID=UPI0015BC2779|nr:phosphoenolpyruvate synthase [Nostoc sp. TCL26-01]QLE54386.1 phosphoenolpyruvate synthase [Nostoc sp. TCL26-01]